MIVNRLNKCLFFLATLSLIACVSPKKKKEDVGFIGRKFQDLTAYYNGYYNANELINNGIDQIIKRNPDNYQELLPIDPVTINRDTNAAGADLKKAVEKLKRVIYLHPASEWVPDSYFLMGKSQYLKRDFETAENSFKYVTQEYSPEKIAKAKSKGKKSAKKKSKKKKSSKKKSTKKENTPTTKSNTTTNKSTTVNKPATTKTTTKKSTKKKSSKKKSKKKKSSSKNKSSSKQTTLKKTNKQKDDIQVEEMQKKEGEKDETTTAIVKTNVESSETQEEDIEIEKIDPIVESKPKKYFLKHKPIYQAARLWLAKTYIERANYDDAGRILRDLKENEGTFNDIRREAYLTHAYLELKNENIVGAIPQLESALTLIKTKKQKARINFILGQLYSTLNKHEAAYEKFASVDKYKPVYEMGFNAKLNMYREQLAIGKISYDELIAKLNKMSKDLKNDEFKDQIYFLLADVALHQNNTNQAITYLQQGIRANKKGTEAKADQFLKIANLFYDREDYINAYHYYDSAAVGYPAKKPYASLIKERQSSLKDIAINLETIQLQDSLLRIAALSKEEQEAFAKRILRERRKNDDKSSTNTGQTNVFDPKGFNRNQGLNAMGLNNQGGLPLTGPKPSTFFAYNEKALKEGKRQFEKVWGNRPLVDNWRVSSMITDFGQNIATNTEDPINKLFISKSEIESVLSEIPNEITLAINITNCPCACKGCHSNYLGKDVGKYLSKEALLDLIKNNEVKYTIWLRKFNMTQKIIYSGIYTTCKLPSGIICVKAIFPLPKGNATVILKPSVGEKQELILESCGNKFGEAGFYFLLHDSKGNQWSQYIRSFTDNLIVIEEKEALKAAQTLKLWKLKVASFEYIIEK